MTAPPIAGYAVLSDRHSAALVSTSGSIDWLCLPRFDSPSVFAAMLDDDAGHWSIRPAGAFTAARRYVESTMVLQTRFETPAGAVVLTDALATGERTGQHQLGARAPHLLIRSLRCDRGSVAVDMRYRPRPEYGLVVPLLSLVPGGVLARGGTEVLALSTPAGPALSAGGADAAVVLRAGDEMHFALHRGALDGPAPRIYSQGKIAAMLRQTVTAWQEWSRAHQAYQGPWRDLVHQSGRVLQALSYQPTGAIVAAPTTSLPECAGGDRNWDYRYCWVRDASLTMQALWVAACPEEAGQFFTFMATAAASYRPQDTLQIMFGVGGEHDLSERVLPHLAGWHGSRPVRVGNGAWTQVQIDVYGELLGAAHLFAGQLGNLDEHARSFLVALADAAARQWRQRDQGIWEVRGLPRHFLHSKLMCWVALDRAIALAGPLNAAGRIPSWTRSREQIRQAIVRHGWSDAAGAFTQSFGSARLDASALMLAITGFLPASDPRMLATITAIEQRLTDDRGLVYRYRDDHDPAGREGTFLLCTFLLAHAQALAGRPGQARATFERAISHANDVGLLAEEAEPGSGELLGNFPQAFSHIGLINAAWAISQAESISPAKPLKRPRHRLLPLPRVPRAGLR